ncbi:hypothetical protein JCM3765_001571 [Sporobolomyces pararoseus]
MLSRCITRPLSIAYKVPATLCSLPSKSNGFNSSLSRPHSTSNSFPLPTAQDARNEGKKLSISRSISKPLSGGKLKTLMIEHLSRSRPRQALDLFLRHLEQPCQSHSGRTLEGLVWIFLSYRQPRLALEAINRMHEKGYQVSSGMATKLLRSFGNELLFDGEHLVKVLNWIKQGIRNDDENGGKVNEEMVETVIQVLKKMGRSDWSAQVFQAYRETLDEEKIGNEKLWAAAITAQAAGGDVMAAQLLFKDWRTNYLNLHSDSLPPPEQPYLALLNHFAVNSPPMPASKDPAYLLLQLTKVDQLPPSTAFLNALLRTELARKRFSSFWGIWNLFDDDTNINSGVSRDHSSWKLATRAKLVSDESRRKRGRIHRSPLLNLSPLPYSETVTPTSRSLFSNLLSTRLELTSRRPSLRLPTSQRDPFAASPTSSQTPSTPLSVEASTTLLNHFLSLFLSYQDFTAAIIVLETFHVHKISPNSSTHSTVVLSIIKLWEKGKLFPNSSRGGDDELMTLFGEGTLGGVEGWERKRKGRVSKNFKGDMAIEAIRRILEKRKFRVGLWQRGSSRIVRDQEGEREREREEEEFELLEEVSAEEPPKWMLQREMRDTSYLIDLLKRCSGFEEDEWRLALTETREELLPPSKKGMSDSGGDEGKIGVTPLSSKRRITRGARYRKERFGKDF